MHYRVSHQYFFLDFHEYTTLFTSSQQRTASLPSARVPVVSSATGTSALLGLSCCLTSAGPHYSQAYVLYRGEAF